MEASSTCELVYLIKQEDRVVDLDFPQSLYAVRWRKVYISQQHKTTA